MSVYYIILQVSILLCTQVYRHMYMYTCTYVILYYFIASYHCIIILYVIDCTRSGGPHEEFADLPLRSDPENK